MKKTFGALGACMLLFGISALQMAQVAEADIQCSWIAWNVFQPTCDEVEGPNDPLNQLFLFDLSTSVHVETGSQESFLVYLEPALGLSENIDYGVCDPGSYAFNDGVTITESGSFGSEVGGLLDNVEQNGSINIAAWSDDFLCTSNWTVDVAAAGNNCPL